MTDDVLIVVFTIVIMCYQNKSVVFVTTKHCV